ncbi:MAG: alpha/beta fold hydrolase [Spirochaetes bacterium]|nr:alpha/beta fold hydrolase [Spirochaetota bacterium]
MPKKLSCIFFCNSLMLMIFAFLLSCAETIEPKIPPMGQESFEQYRLETIEWIRKHRNFQTEDIEEEILWNAPKEWLPANESRKRGILLVHGLGNSPWDFIDIAPVLAANNFLVRAILLAGCGTKPSDLIHVTLDDWRRQISEQVAILSREVEEVFLGGFSAGANLVLEYAINNPEIKGLLLLSPAIKTRIPLDFMAPILSRFTTWLVNTRTHPMQLPHRYLAVPTNALNQFFHSRASARFLLRKNPYTRPVLIVQTKHDHIVNSRYVLRLFDSRFTNPNSRLIWYGEIPDRMEVSSRVLVRPDYLPEWRISQFSHISILFSPENEAFGRGGSQRMCWNGQTQEDYELCLLGAEVWYSDWGFREPGKIHARLTFNPYFDWQSEIMMEVLNSRSCAMNES